MYIIPYDSFGSLYEDNIESFVDTVRLTYKDMLREIKE
jgi:hypothetical protein